MDAEINQLRERCDQLKDGVADLKSETLSTVSTLKVGLASLRTETLNAISALKHDAFEALGALKADSFSFLSCPNKLLMLIKQMLP
jgi:hypothetical protein